VGAGKNKNNPGKFRKVPGVGCSAPYPSVFHTIWVWISPRTGGSTAPQAPLGTRNPEPALTGLNPSLNAQGGTSFT